MKDHLVSFDDTEIAFKSRTDKELKQAYWLFKIISFNWLVQISPPFVKFALWAKLPVKGLIRSTIFHHFCGGETIEGCQSTINKLASYKIGTILDYSVEGKESEEDFEHSLTETRARRNLWVWACALGDSVRVLQFPIVKFLINIYKTFQLYFCLFYVWNI